jgi:peptidoglycan/LPS O-acetylase OafA/YrhL
MLVASPNQEAAQQAWVAGLIGAGAASAGALAAFVHWKRFRVPITVAAGAASVAAIVVALIAAFIGDTPSTMDIVLGVVLLLGIGVFLHAMRWDSSDPSRITRRSDVAFWLHLLAAPMIVHPVFTLLGLNDGDATVGEGLVVVAI